MTIMICCASATFLMVLCGISFNCIVIYTFAKARSLHTVNNVFLCQLAIVDCAKAAFILPVKCYFQFTSTKHFHNDAGFFCQFAAFLSSYTYFHSSTLLALIAVLRYFKIVRPFQFSIFFSKKRVILYTIIVFVQSLSVSILPIIGLGRYTYSSYHGNCFADWSSVNKLYRLLAYAFAIGFNYPALIICYATIYFSLKKHKKYTSKRLQRSKERETAERSKSRCQPINAIATHSNGNHDENEYNTEKRNHIRFMKSSENGENYEENIKVINDSSKGNSNGEIGILQAKEDRHRFVKEIEVTKIMFMMVIAYSLCWLPAFVINLLCTPKSPRFHHQSFLSL